MLIPNLPLLGSWVPSWLQKRCRRRNVYKSIRKWVVVTQYDGFSSGTFNARCSYVCRSPFMFNPEFPDSDGGHTVATPAAACASASQNSPLIYLVIGAPGSLAVDEQKQPVLVDVDR